MKTTKAAKGERRAHRKAKERRRDERIAMQVLGGVMDPELQGRLMAATDAFDIGGGWDAMAPRLLPVLKRLRHPYPAELAPLHVQVPPGIWTGFGVDIGPAFNHVSAAMADRWGVDHATLLGTSLENLCRRIVDDPPSVEEVDVDAVPVVVVQGQGWGSSLLLLPDALRPILGARARLLIAPVRNTLVALPEDADPGLVADLWDAIAAGAPDELDIRPMRWTGSSVVTIADRALGLPN